MTRTQLITHITWVLDGYSLGYFDLIETGAWISRLIERTLGCGVPSDRSRGLPTHRVPQREGQQAVVAPGIS